MLVKCLKRPDPPQSPMCKGLEAGRVRKLGISQRYIFTLKFGDFENYVVTDDSHYDVLREVDFPVVDVINLDEILKRIIVE